MNPHLASLEPYPFEKLNALKAGLSGNPQFEHVALSIGEPKHPAPDFVVNLLIDPQTQRAGLGSYPATRGSADLRESIAAWVLHRFQATLDPATQILPVAGTREALFSFGQAVLSGQPGSLAVLPNPFYQIYEGAVLLRGAEPYFVACTASNGYQPDYATVPEAVWQRCELLYLCSPGNPSGRVLDSETLVWLMEQADRYDFVIAADECYSEIYMHEQHPPVGLLQAAWSAGRTDFRRCVVFHSLSKRSNLPGLRSGFVAGDASILAGYYQYRTYEGCALPDHVQAVSAAAWRDETHVAANREAYRAKFEALTPLLRQAFDVRDPDGGFYHWLPTPIDDQAFARALFADCNITVLPGSYLGREFQGVNPGAGHVRLAWVAPHQACVDAAQRMVRWALNNPLLARTTR